MQMPSVHNMSSHLHARAMTVALLLLGAQLVAARALACGVSGPDGVWSCSLQEHEESERLRWHVGGSGLYTSTRLRFTHGLRGDEERAAAIASATYAPARWLTLQGSAGATLDGQLRLPTGRYEISPGPLLALGAAWRVVDGPPFLIATSLLSFSAVTTQLPGPTTHAVGYEAFDLRAGALFGTTLLHVLSPYALARVFGGPVFWHHQGTAVTGTDLYHYQLGAGLALLIAERLDLFVEGSVLGERALAGGAALAF
jgi:hypothetical protein